MNFHSLNLSISNARSDLTLPSTFVFRGEKYYPGGRIAEGSTKQRYLCWGGILAVIVAVLVFIILLSSKSETISS